MSATKFDYNLKTLARNSNMLKEALEHSAKQIVEWQGEDKENILHLCKLCWFYCSGPRNEDF